MTSNNIQELTDRVWRSVTQDAYDATDIGILISKVIDLEEKANALQVKCDALEEDRVRLVRALEIASESNESLRARLDKYEHLTQFAEAGEQ